MGGGKHEKKMKMGDIRYWSSLIWDLPRLNRRIYKEKKKKIIDW